MKAVIVELNKDRAAVLSDNGCIKTIKNKNYEVGQVIQISSSKISNYRKLIVSAASAAAALVLGTGTWAYASPYTYVSLDVNPSIEYSVNRFDRVIKVKAVNDDGEEILKEISIDELTNETIENAVITTVNQLSESGYFEGDAGGGIVITTSSQDMQKADELAQDLHETVEEQNVQNGDTVVVDTFIVGLERVKEAKALGVTPGKLNLVEKLQETVGNAAEINIDEWLDKPVKDILKATTDYKKASKTADTKKAEDSEDSAKAQKPEASADEVKVSGDRLEDDDKQENKDKDTQASNKDVKQTQKDKDKALKDAEKDADKGHNYAEEASGKKQKDTVKEKNKIQKDSSKESNKNFTDAGKAADKALPDTNQGSNKDLTDTYKEKDTEEDLTEADQDLDKGLTEVEQESEKDLTDIDKNSGKELTGDDKDSNKDIEKPEGKKDDQTLTQIETEDNGSTASISGEQQKTEENNSDENTDSDRKNGR